MKWQSVKLGDCMRLINGRAYSQHELLDEGTPIIRIQNLNGGERWYYSNLQLPDDKYCVNGDLLFAWSATFGPYIWNGEKSIYHYHIWKIEPFNTLDKRFAYHTLLWITNSIKHAARGASMLHMTKAGMEKWEIPLPPIAEQQRIAALLDTADSILKQRESAIAKLDQLTQSVFVEMFGDPVRNTKNFPMKNIGELPIHIADGNYSSKYPSSSEFVESGIPFIRANNLKNLTLVNDDVRYITERKHSELAKGHLKFRDVVIVTRGEIGKVGLVPMEFDDANMNAQLVLLRPNSSMLLPEYLCHFFNNNYTKSYVKNFETGVALKQLPIGNLKKIQISLPPIELQNEFANIVKKIEIQIEFLNVQKASIYSMLSSLQHQSFAVN